MLQEGELELERSGGASHDIRYHLVPGLCKQCDQPSGPIVAFFY